MQIPSPFRADQPPLEKYKDGDAVYFRRTLFPSALRDAPERGAWVRGTVTSKTLHPLWQESEPGLVIQIDAEPGTYRDKDGKPIMNIEVKKKDVQTDVKLLNWTESAERRTPGWALAAAAALAEKTRRRGGAKKRRKSHKRKSHKRKSHKRKSRKRKSRTRKSRK